MHRPRRRLVEARDQPGARVRERDPATWPGKADLAGMQVPREDEIERPDGNPVDDAGEVAEQQAKALPGAFELMRLRPSRPVALRVLADDRHRGSPQRDRLDLVAQQGRALEVVELRGPRERVTSDGDIVVPENDEGAVEDVQQLTQPSFAARMRDEVPGDADDVRPPLRDPHRRPSARAVAARQARTEVEVGEVGDANAVQLARKPVDGNVEDARSQPACLEPAVGDAGERGAGEEDKDG